MTREELDRKVAERLAEKRKAFVKELAFYLAGRQVEMSIRLQRDGSIEARQWARLRGTTPLLGYPTEQEAEDQLNDFLFGDGKKYEAVIKPMKEIHVDL